MKRTKIVSTIGPATDSKETLKKIIENGVNVARQNFSHVDHEAHEELYEKLRDVSSEIAIMADTKGPEIRLGEVKENTELKQGQKVTLKTQAQDQKGDEETLPINYEELPQHVEKGDEVRIDDGIIELKVKDTTENTIEAEILFGGKVSSRKAVNVPGKDIGLNAPTKKDKKDIKFAAKKGFDFLSLSFVKQAEDIHRVREILKEHGSEMQIISKIEHRKAVENFDEILEASDAIMVARGDLGVEMPPEKLPQLQKEMIQKSNEAGKPVITATQMLESMTENPSATRAEISDVGNAVMDGTDAVMLSGETAMGDYPVKTVKFMSKIVQQAEKQVENNVHCTVKQRPENTREIICKNVWQAARDGDSELIVAHTTSGSTARNISKYRPKKPIIAFTDKEKTKRQLQLAWGVEPRYQEFHETVEGMVKDTAQKLKTLNKVEENDEIVLSAGIPTSVTGTTNMMQIREIKSLINS